MTRSNDQAALEQTLTERLAQLPVPIRIIHHKPEHGAWYQWKTLVTGTGDCGTFADAVIQAITYQQEQQQQQALIATPACAGHAKSDQPRSSTCTWARKAGWKVCRPMNSW